MMVPGLAQLQIIQEEVDRFLFRIVKGADFGSRSLDSHPLAGGRTCLVPGVRYECEFVDRIPQEPSGKYRFCISRVKPHFSGASDGAHGSSGAYAANRMNQ